MIDLPKIRRENEERKALIARAEENAEGFIFGPAWVKAKTTSDLLPSVTKDIDALLAECERLQKRVDSLERGVQAFALAQSFSNRPSVAGSEG